MNIAGHPRRIGLLLAGAALLAGCATSAEAIFFTGPTPLRGDIPARL